MSGFETMVEIMLYQHRIKVMTLRQVKECMTTDKFIKFIWAEDFCIFIVFIYIQYIDFVIQSSVNNKTVLIPLLS